MIVVMFHKTHEQLIVPFRYCRKVVNAYYNKTEEKKKKKRAVQIDQ